MYIITYKDNTTFNGGNIQNSKWNEIDKPILRIEYNLTNKPIIMQGYERYNHLIEYGWMSNVRKKITTAIYIMGLKNNKVDVIKINCVKKRITSSKKQFGKELSDSSTTGWKEGIKNIPCGYEIN